MMNWRHNLFYGWPAKHGRAHWLAVLLVAWLLAIAVTGCTNHDAAISATSVKLPPGQTPEETIQAPWPVPAERARVPVTAPWLADLVQVQYHQFPATTALEQLVPHGLLAFHFAPPPGETDKHEDVPLVLVNALSGKASRQEHIDALCATADWAWSVINRVVVISDTATRTFDISTLPGQSTGRVNNSQLVSSNGGASTSSVDQITTSNPQEDLLDAINHLTGDDTASLLASTGQLVVTARPSLLDRIARVVAAQNEAASRRVALEFVLYEVDVSDQRARQLNLDALRDAAINASLSVTHAGNPIQSGSGDLTLGVRDGVDSPNSSSVVFRWLQEQGETEVRIRKTVVAVHNQVTELSDVETVRYVEQVSIERENSGSTTTATPSVRTGKANIGETWSILPTITGGVVTLRLAAARADLVGFKMFDFGDGAISGSLPQTAASTISTPIRLRDGETRVITDLSNARDNNRTVSSPLLSWLPWLGKAVHNTDTKLETVMTMTARIL